MAICGVSSVVEHKKSSIFMNRFRLNSVFCYKENTAERDVVNVSVNSKSHSARSSTNFVGTEKIEPYKCAEYNRIFY
jgi:hypothetical protein